MNDVRGGVGFGWVVRVVSCQFVTVQSNHADKFDCEGPRMIQYGTDDVLNLN